MDMQDMVFLVYLSLLFEMNRIKTKRFLRVHDYESIADLLAPNTNSICNYLKSIGRWDLAKKTLQAVN